MFKTKTKYTSGSLIKLLTAEGINNPMNRTIVHLLHNEKTMLYSELAMQIGNDHVKFATHIRQLINRNIINRDINSSRLSLNMPYIKDKGYKI